MAAQQTRVEVISNNLANMSTTGYNARRAEFADLHYQQMTRAGTINAADRYVRVSYLLKSSPKYDGRMAIASVFSIMRAMRPAWRSSPSRPKMRARSPAL